MYKLTKDFIKDIPDGYGVYRIFVRTKKNLPIRIPRFAAVDETGLIYIGRAVGQFLRRRVANFEITARQNSNTTNHSGAMKYKTFDVIRRRLSEDHELYFVYEFCDNPAYREKELLIEYRHKYGDTPLLNG
jgi:hypothetical protein